MSDAQRLDDLREQCSELDREISRREFTGEDYDDGISLQTLIEMRETSRTALDREERRQTARTRYGKHEERAPEEPGDSTQSA